MTQTSVPPRVRINCSPLAQRRALSSFPVTRYSPRQHPCSVPAPLSHSIPLSPTRFITFPGCSGPVSAATARTQRTGRPVSLQLLSCNSLLIYNLFAVSDVWKGKLLSQQLWKASFFSEIWTPLSYPGFFFFFWFCRWRLTSVRQGGRSSWALVTRYLLERCIQR